MKVQVGHPVELPCVAQGVPEPSISWLKDGVALEVSRGDYRLSGDGSLKVRKVGLDDEGVYTCRASNVAGQDEANIQILVQGRPLYITSQDYLR